MKRHLTLCLLGSLLLTGCGFTPIYASKGEGRLSTQTALNNIKIEKIPNEYGVYLHNKLMDRLYFNGRPTAPEAQLHVSFTTSEVDLGIKKDATSTRSRLTISANFILQALNEKAVLLKGQASTIASYSKLDAQYGTLATQRDAYKRALNEISEQIVNRLSLFYAEKAPFKEKALNAK